MTFQIGFLKDIRVLVVVSDYILFNPVDRFCSVLLNLNLFTDLIGCEL